MTPETAVKKQITDWLTASRVWWTRMQVASGSMNGGKSWFRAGKKGMADLLCAPMVCGQPVFLWVEVKAPHGTQSQEQCDFAEEVMKRGHHYIIARGFEDVQRWMLENKAHS